MATDGDPDKQPTRCRCPRCGPYVEDVAAAERDGVRTEDGELIRWCVACVVQRLHDTRKGGYSP